MLLNLLILVFLIAMIVVWAHYGLFSSFLHLCLVIVAGALSIGLWEPLAQGLLMGRMPHYAWAVGLLAPLVLMLIGFHLVQDRLVGVSVQFPDIANKIGGAVFGLIAGMLTAGLVVIGVGFTAMPAKVLGHQKFTILGTGPVDTQQTKSLWVPVDGFAAGFFGMLSTGSFSTGSPLAVYRPQVADLAQLHRLRVDPHSAPSLMPGLVSIEAMYEHPTHIPAMPQALADGLGPQFEDKAGQLVVIRTRWQRHDSAGLPFDTDRTLRVVPSQVRLVTVKRSGSGYTDARLVQPVAFTGKSDTDHLQAYFHPIDTDRATAFGFNDREDITFAFLAEQGRVPLFLMIRGVRFPLPAEPSKDARQLIAALGTPPPAVAGTDDPGDETPTNLAAGEVAMPDGVGLRVDNSLPARVSKLHVQGKMEWDNDNDENAIVSGEATAGRADRAHGTRRLLTHIAQNGEFPLVRMRITGEMAQQYFGSTDTSAQMRTSVFLTDDRGNTPKPKAVIWVKNNGEQYIHVRPGSGSFANGGAIGIIPRMQRDEDLLLFFPVQRGAQVVGYQIGSGPPTTVDPPLRVE